MRFPEVMKMKQPHLLKRAFTLVEILIVVCIIALLAALLFPVFKSVRDSARTASCASNLGQIGKALAFYTQDHNERLPLIAHSDGLTWVDSVFPYARSTQVFECPSAEHGQYVPGGSPNAPLVSGTAGPEYGGNGSYDLVTPLIETQRTAGSSLTTYVIYPKGLSLQRYRFPSSTILVLDGGDTTYFFHNNYAAVNPGIDPIHSVADLNDGGVVVRHKDGVNLLYVDGHVKWGSLQSLASTPMWRPDGREPVATPTPTATPAK
jgi:prepilin-type processing-associated H-X9-DG protein/prepilin-type N-terminal cleavage/methylation domain-containing protein